MRTEHGRLEQVVPHEKTPFGSQLQEHRRWPLSKALELCLEEYADVHLCFQSGQIEIVMRVRLRPVMDFGQAGDESLTVTLEIEILDVQNFEPRFAHDAIGIEWGSGGKPA
jgi:hypothetical protein